MSTLSATEIALDTIDSFKVQFPMLFKMGTTFKNPDGSRTGLLNQDVTGRISTLPTVRDYDASTGYKANAADANDLSEDVTVTLDRHKHVPVKVDYLNELSTNRDQYQEAIGNLAYALGKEAVDFVCSLVVAANFSQSETYSHANSDLDMLLAVKKKANGTGMAPRGRFGVVNSDVMNTLEADSRIASGDFHGQRSEENPYGHLQNVAGFEDIFEYPGTPTNSENLSSFFADRTAFVFASRVPDKAFDAAEAFGIPQQARTEVFEDPDSGLAFLGIFWQDPHTFDNYMTFAHLYGATAGMDGGSAGDKTDYGAVRVITV